MKLARAGHAGAIVSLTGLIALAVAWELWLAPLRPGGSWMVLKAIPLLLPLFGILHGRRRTCLAAAILVLLYFMEGTMRAYAETGLSAQLALLQALLAAAFIAATAVFLRARRDPSP